MTQRRRRRRARRGRFGRRAFLAGAGCAALAGAAVLFLTALLLWLWIDVIRLGDHLGGVCEWLAGYGFEFAPKDLAASLAPLLNMVITIPLNFIINKFWAYRQKKKPKEE